MLISEFSRQSGLPQDTVRFYIRRGLLAPATSDKGGRNPYQIFTGDHVQQARMIRMAQSLGMSLKEIALISAEHESGRLTKARSAEIMASQLDKLDAKVRELQTMGAYLRAKLAWMRDGERGSAPEFPHFAMPGTATGESCEAILFREPTTAASARKVKAGAA